MGGLSLESWAVCHVGRSFGTGAQMKRLAGGSRVCLLHGCSDRPLVFFQRVWEHVCESENLLTSLLGLCRCVCDWKQVCACVWLWKHVCLCTIVVEGMPQKTTCLCLCLCSCIRWWTWDPRGVERHWNALWHCGNMSLTAPVVCDNVVNWNIHSQYDAAQPCLCLSLIFCPL